MEEGRGGLLEEEAAGGALVKYRQLQGALGQAEDRAEAAENWLTRSRARGPFDLPFSLSSFTTQDEGSLCRRPGARGLRLRQPHQRSRSALPQGPQRSGLAWALRPPM